MSLYKFLESYIQDTPELLLFNSEKPIKFDSLFSHMKEKQCPCDIKKFLDIFLYDQVNRYSTNLREYEILRLKTLRLACPIWEMMNKH